MRQLLCNKLFSNLVEVVNGTKDRSRRWVLAHGWSMPIVFARDHVVNYRAFYRSKKEKFTTTWQMSTSKIRQKIILTIVFWEFKICVIVIAQSKHRVTYYVTLWVKVMKRKADASIGITKRVDTTITEAMLK